MFVPGGETSQIISIDINDDQEMESNEPFVVNFSSMDIPPDMPIDLPTPEIVIIDDDMSEWSVYFTFSAMFIHY